MFSDFPHRVPVLRTQSLFPVGGEERVINLAIFFVATPSEVTVALGMSRVMFSGLRKRVPVLRSHSLSPTSGGEGVINSCIYIFFRRSQAQGLRNTKEFVLRAVASEISQKNCLAS